jgi:hypothetical protein
MDLILIVKYNYFFVLHHKIDIFGPVDRGVILLEWGCNSVYFYRFYAFCRKLASEMTCCNRFIICYIDLTYLR